MSEHKILEEDLGIDVFCDPFTLAKGTCENMNGLIRQYLPKIDLNQADQHYLNQVASLYSSRKALDWLHH